MHDAQSRLQAQRIIDQMHLEIECERSFAEGMKSVFEDGDLEVLCKLGYDPELLQDADYRRHQECYLRGQADASWNILRALERLARRFGLRYPPPGETGLRLVIDNTKKSPAGGGA